MLLGLLFFIPVQLFFTIVQRQELKSLNGLYSMYSVLQLLSSEPISSEEKHLAGQRI